MVTQNVWVSGGLTACRNTKCRKQFFNNDLFEVEGKGKKWLLKSYSSPVVETTADNDKFKHFVSEAALVLQVLLYDSRPLQ